MQLATFKIKNKKEEVLEPVQSDDLPSFAEEVMVEAAVQEGEKYASLQVSTFLKSFYLTGIPH